MKPVALVVDDQIDARMIAEVHLTTLGFQVIQATDGDEALELIESHPDKFSLLFTDCMMPRMIGPILIRKIYQKNLGIKTIVLSSALSPNEDPIASLLSEEAYPVHFIQKGTAGLLDRLKMAINQGCLRPQAARVAFSGIS